MRISFAALVAVMLAGCAYQTPPRVDPIADLVGGMKVVESPDRTIDAAKTKRLALIVSSSTETQFKFREENTKQYLEYVKNWESKSYSNMKAMHESIGPRLLTETVVTQLRKRFGNVTVVSDLVAFREQGFDIAAVFDVGMEAAGSSSALKNAGEYTTDISLIFFDKQIRRIGIAQGKASGKGERSNVGDMAKALLLFLPDPTQEEMAGPLIRAEIESRQAAFEKLNQSMDSIVR
jgi:hypothetical protein